VVDCGLSSGPTVVDDVGAADASCRVGKNVGDDVPEEVDCDVGVGVGDAPLGPSVVDEDEVSVVDVSGIVGADVGDTTPGFESVLRPAVVDDEG
jgi:hypothetical protein